MHQGKSGAGLALRAVRQPASPLAGEIVSERVIPGFTLIEMHYRAGTVVDPHSHDQTHLVFVLEGAFHETTSVSSVECREGSLRILPAGYLHGNRFEQDCRCVMVRLEQASVERFGRGLRWLERPGDVFGLASGWLATRLHREFQAQDEAAPVAIEGLLLEILAETARLRGSSGPAVPRWLRTAREFIEANLLRPLGLVEIANAAGVHRVHLAREFRRYFKCTVGEYIRRRRVEHACHLIAHTNMPLSEIASKCGFSDQSHFSATFRKQVGATPARFRALHPEP
jgi:AraC family transcriptional regulator